MRTWGRYVGPCIKQMENNRFRTRSDSLKSVWSWISGKNLLCCLDGIRNRCERLYVIGKNVSSKNGEQTFLRTCELQGSFRLSFKDVHFEAHTFMNSSGSEAFASEDATRKRFWITSINFLTLRNKTLILFGLMIAHKIANFLFMQSTATN